MTVKWRVSAVVSLAAAMLVGSIVPAHAQEHTLNGMTEDEFVVAAHSITGFDEQLLREVWDDPKLRASIPVEIVYVDDQSGTALLPMVVSARTDSIDVTTLATRPRTASRTAYAYGGFNNLLFTFTTTKSWTYNGTRVWSGGATYSYNINNWTWEFSSASTSGRYVHGQGTNSGHLTVQSGTFSWVGGMDSRAVTNEITGWKNGSSHTRSY